MTWSELVDKKRNNSIPLEDAEFHRIMDLLCDIGYSERDARERISRVDGRWTLSHRVFDEKFREK